VPLGWYGAHPPIRQSYSGPASPYWASKGFAGLLLPADHPVWTAVEEPLPVERGDFVRTLHAPGWTASGTRADGIVRIANHGADHADRADLADRAELADSAADAATAATADRGSVGRAAYDPFYCRWAYSTATGPELGGVGPGADADGVTSPSAPDLELPGGGPLDSHVALLDAGGRPSHRRPLHRTGAGRSRHRARWPQADTPDGPWLSTGSVLRGPWEVRAVLIDGEPAPGTRLRIGGWAVAGAEPPATTAAGGRAEAVAPDGLRGVVTALHGDGLRAAVRTSTGRTSYAPHAAVPYLESGGPVHRGELFVAAIALGRSAEAAGPAPQAEVEDGRVMVRWPDGHRDELLLQGSPEGNTGTTEFPQE
jgi:hypothetical protein